MDKYTKFILTMIAVGIIGINFHLIKGDIISKAEANHDSVGPYMRSHVIIENWPSCN